MDVVVVQNIIMLLGIGMSIMILARSYIKLGLSRLKTAIVLTTAIFFASSSICFASALPNTIISENEAIKNEIFSSTINQVHKICDDELINSLVDKQMAVIAAETSNENSTQDTEVLETVVEEQTQSPEQEVIVSEPQPQLQPEPMSGPEPASVPEPEPESEPEPELIVTSEPEPAIEQPSMQEWWSSNGWLVYDPPHTDELFYYWNNYYCAHRDTLYGSLIANAEIGSTILLDGNPVQLLGREYFLADVLIEEVLNVVGWDKICFQTCNETDSNFQVVYGVYV